MGKERLALRGFPLFFSSFPSRRICRVVVPAPAVLPLRGALPFREPTPPKPSTTTRRGLDFLGSSLFSSFLSFFPFILPCLLVLFFYPPPSYSFLLCLHSSLFLPSSSFLLVSSFVSFPPFFPSSYLTSFALHRFTSTCNIIICHPLSAVTLFSVGAARVPAPEKNQTLPAIHETQALPSFTRALCAPW